MTNSEESYTLERVPEIFFRLDEEGRVVYLNEAWSFWSNLSPDSVQGRNFQDQLPKGERELFKKAFEELLDQREGQKELLLSLFETEGKEQCFRVLLRCQENLEGTCSIEGLAKLNPKGDEQEASSKGAASELSDFLLKEGEREEKELLYRFALFADSAPDPLLESDPNGKLRYMNPVAKSLANEFGEEGQADYLPKKHQELVAHVSRKKRGVYREVELDDRTLLWYYAPSKDPELIHIHGRDITEQKDAQERLLEAIIQTQEEERERFAKELHEGIGQYLSATLMEFEGFKEQLDYHQLKQADRIESLIQKVLRDVRSVSKSLMPRMLKEFGLESALQEFLKEKELGHGLRISLQTSFSEDALEERLRIGLYRIVEELVEQSIHLRNAVACSVDIKEDECGIVLEYQDEEGGRKPADERSLKAIRKLDSMIRSLQGRFDLNFEKGKAKIRIRIPFR